MQSRTVAMSCTRSLPSGSPSSWPTPGSNPSVSICPSYSRAAVRSSAARWRCIHDSLGHCDRHQRRADRISDRAGRALHRPQLFTAAEGRRYLDCLAAYSAVNFGHRNSEIIATAHAQLDVVTLVSRAFHAEALGRFCAALATLCGKDMVLPMNSGAEAVESAIKVARKWGVDVKGVPAGQANIIVADNNFHGRTISIVSFSSDETARCGFGPFTPGFRSGPFGDAEALADAIDEHTVAVLLEPIQGEAGVITPPDHYLPAVREICT